MLLWLLFLRHVSKLTSLKIDLKATIDDRTANQPDWVTDAIAKRPNLKYAKPISKYCQSVEVFDKMEFPGSICFVSIWKDISLSTIKADPRRKFCETLAWGYTKEQDEVCSMLDKSTSHCYGDYNFKKHAIGFVPSLCPQFPCRDYQILKTGTSKSPPNQVVHLKLPTPFDQSINETVFEATDLRYIRVDKKAKTPFTTHTECPSNMRGISYFWDATKQKSCTVTSASSGGTDPNERFVQERCRGGNMNEEFLGCVFNTYDDCIAALADPEFVDIVDPKAVFVSMTVFIELILIGDRVDENLEKSENMANANGESDSEFAVSSRINLAEFSFALENIRKNFRICSDELFSLQQFIPALDPSFSLKLCLRLTKWKTFMPANGEIYVKFTPYFSVTLRKQGSSSSLGFSGGIEYKAADFIAHINMTKETDWMDQPDQSAFVREDLKWFKPVEYKPRDDYKSPPDYTMFAVLGFLGAMAFYFLLMFKKYVVLKREEVIHERMEAKRAAHEEEKKLKHELWEQQVLEKEQKYKNEMNAFVAQKAAQLLTAKNARNRPKTKKIDMKKT